MGNLKKFGISIAALSFLISGCSPSSFFGNDTDQEIRNQPGYRRVNAQCSSVDLSRDELDVTTTRQLVDCLNSQGALGSFATFVHTLKDDELAPFVNSVNRSILRAPQKLFALEKTFNDLDARGELTETIGALSVLLKNETLIEKSISLLREAYAPRGAIDPLLLASLAQISEHLTAPLLSDLMDFALVLTESRAFSSLWDRLTGPSAKPLSPETVESILSYSRSTAHMGEQLVSLAADGSFFEGTGRLVPEVAEEIKGVVPGWAAILNHSLEKRAYYASKISLLLEAYQKPIPCLQGTQEMRSIPMDLLRELSTLPREQVQAYFARDKVIQTFVAAPLCSFPPSLHDDFQLLEDFATTSAGEPLIDIAKAFYPVTRGVQHPIAEFFIQSLSDRSFRLFLPALSDLTERLAWEDLLLLATAPRLDDKSKAQALLAALVKPLPSQDTPWSVLVSGLKRTQAPQLAAWLRSFSISTDSRPFHHAIKGARAAFYVNDAHPLIDLAREALKDAPQDPKLLETLLKVSAKPEFLSALKELRDMSRSQDGRLKDILYTTLSLFHRHAERGRTEIVSLAPGKTAPSSRTPARHSWAALDLPHASRSIHLVDFGACRKIDFNVAWDDVAHRDFEAQFDIVTACVGSGGQYADLTRALQLLRQEYTSSNAGPARSYHALLVEAYRALQYSKQEIATLTHLLFAQIRDGRLGRALHVLPIWERHQLIRPLIDLVSPIPSNIEARLGLKRLGVYGSTVLRRADFQSLLAYVDDLYRAKTPAPSAPFPQGYDAERIKRWVANKECSSLPTVGREAAQEARYQEIIEEYENAVTPHGPRVNGKLPQAWTTASLKEQFAPVLAKLANPTEHGPILKAFLRFATRFNDPKQYPPGYLEEWLRKRAADKKLVMYYYPGETQLRVRMLNGLDRLSNVLINANIYIPEPVDQNVGMLFLSQIGDAWGDVPFEERPPEIREKYPKEGRKKIKTLAQAVADINETAETFYDFVGYPAFDKCEQTANPNDPPEVQAAETTNPTSLAEIDPNNPPDPKLQASVLNIHETIDVLNENLANGGIRIFRDFFYEINYSTPKEFREPGAGLRNNLIFVIKLCELSVFTQAGRAVSSVAPDQQSVRQFFSLLLEAASLPETEEALKPLFESDPNQELIWNIVDQILSLKDPAEIQNAKTLGHYGLAAIDLLGKGDGPKNQLLGPLVYNLGVILSKYMPFLNQHADLVGDLVKWEEGALFVRSLALDRSPQQNQLTSLLKEVLQESQRGLDLMAILSAIDSDPSAHSAWKTFSERFKALDSSADYQALNLGEIGRQLLNFLEGRATPPSAPLTSQELALSRKILHQLAAQLERGDMELIDQLLILAKRKPNDLHHLLISLSRLIENGEIPKFLDVIQNSLTPAAGNSENQ